MDELKQVESTVPELELSQAEEILALKEQVSFLMEAWEQSRKDYESILESMGKLMEKDAKDKAELSRWTHSAEDRLRKLMVQNLNMSLIINTAVPLTEDQKAEIQSKYEEMKKKSKEPGE